MTSKKIKALLNISGKDLTGLANYMGISRQALSNKLYRGSFSEKDLTKIANYTNSVICFIHNENKIILNDEVTY